VTTAKKCLLFLGLLLLSVLCFNIATTDALLKYFWGRQIHQTRRDYIFDRMMKVDSTKEYDEQHCADDPNKNVKVDYYTQKLDHFADVKDGFPQTWEQASRSI
jgi:hypothetical protein